MAKHLAEESEPTEDPLGGLRTELCDQVQLLQPTSTCAVYDPATETSTNPYTPNGDSRASSVSGFSDCCRRSLNDER